MKLAKFLVGFVIVTSANPNDKTALAENNSAKLPQEVFIPKEKGG